jgi:tetratricopeptide (TPR) repeat protein
MKYSISFTALFILFTSILGSTFASPSYANSPDSIQSMQAICDRSPDCHAGDEAYKQKNYSQAVQYFSRAISSNPNLAVYYVSRSQAYNKLKQFQLAFDDANKAISISPRYGFGYETKADAVAGYGATQERPLVFIYKVSENLGLAAYYYNLSGNTERANHVLFVKSKMDAAIANSAAPSYNVPYARPNIPDMTPMYDMGTQGGRNSAGYIK